MDVYIRPYREDDFDEFKEIYLEEYGTDSPIESRAREELMRQSMTSSLHHMMSVRRAIDGEHVGRLEVHESYADIWELGIYILKKHRFQGAGKAAVSLYLDWLHDTFGKSDFVVRIELENAASIALFEGLGFKFVGKGPANGGSSNTTLDDVLAHVDAEDDPDLVHAITESFTFTRREVLKYEVHWQQGE